MVELEVMLLSENRDEDIYAFPSAIPSASIYYFLHKTQFLRGKNASEDRLFKISESYELRKPVKPSTGSGEKAWRSSLAKQLLRILKQPSLCASTRNIGILARKHKYDPASREHKIPIAPCMYIGGGSSQKEAKKLRSIPNLARKSISTHSTN